ncbi:MAG: helix-turn-helix transcriptional regulator [Alphaproteobacteria bacterium]
MPSDDPQAELILALYDAALDSDRWASCFAQIRALVGASSSLASVLRPERGEIRLLDCGAPDAFVQGYLETWWPKDLWMLEADRRRGRVVVGSEMLPDLEFVRSEVYNELVRPTSDVRDVIGIVFDLHGWKIVMGLHRPAAGTFDEREKRMVRWLVPHVSRSLELSLRFEELAGAARASRAAIDGLAYGVLVVDARCRPVVTNRAAEAMLAAADGLSYGIDRALSVRNPPDGDGLRRLVADATSPVPGPGGAMRIARPSGRPDYVALVAPLAGERMRMFGTPGRMALLIVQDPALAPVPRAEIFRQLHGLSAAEAQIVAGLVRGLSPEEIADLRGVRIATMRAQIRSILAKTGAGRLIDVVRMAAALPGLRDP